MMTNAHAGIGDQDDRERAGKQPGESSNDAGSSSMPTETKNSTANASRIGNASEAARRL